MSSVALTEYVLQNEQEYIMKKNKGRMNDDHREPTEVKPTSDNSINKKDKTILHKHLSSISNKLNLYLLVSYK